VIRTDAGLDFEHRFTEAIDILLAGYAAPGARDTPRTD
jgi:hypothetical protein